MKGNGMKKILLFVAVAGICIITFVTLYAKHPSGAACAARTNPGEITIGMNLSNLSFWTRELPFVDVAKGASPWVTQNDHTVPGGKNPFNTEVLASILLDDNGYPLSLPVEVKGTEAPQITVTLMCASTDGHYPAGRYVCLYEGSGDIRFFFDAKEASRTPGRIELDVKPSNSGILMKIMRSDPGDHIRKIRVIMPGFEADYASRPFNPLFLKRLQPFKVIRFMDWQRTNNSVLVQWARRTTPSTYTQTGPQGVAVEYMVALCNAIGADPWFCIPHQADSDFIRQFARLVKGSLKPDRKVYLEYSNEVWNAMFAQYQWVEKNGNTSLSHPQKYAALALRGFVIWQDEFGKDKGHIVRVLSGQQVRPAVMEDIIDYARPSGMDALATSAYFGLSMQGYQDLRGLGPRATDHDVLRSVYDNMRAQEIPAMEKHAKLAEKYGIRYITYEGGPSICPMPLGVSPAYQQALWDAQKSRELYGMYREFLMACRDMHLELFMAYSFVTLQESRFGSWGHLGYLDQPEGEAPKYRALIDEINVRRTGDGKPGTGSDRISNKSRDISKDFCCALLRGAAQSCSYSR
jgi:hypothetical protein